MVSSAFLDAVFQPFSVLFKGKNFIRLLGGLGVTARIAAISVVLSIFFGFMFGAAMTVRFRPIKFLCRLYLEFMRIMPQMVLLFLAYFGLTYAFGISISGEAASVLVFTLWGTAEMGDLVRGALQSIPLHQYESGRAVGLTENQIFRFIIIPQTVRQLVPLRMNLITRMIKTTSLAVFAGVTEVVKTGQQIIESNRISVPSAAIAVYSTIFFMYFAVCWPLSFIAGKIEKRQRKS